MATWAQTPDVFWKAPTTPSKFWVKPRIYYNPKSATGSHLLLSCSWLWFPCANKNSTFDETLPPKCCFQHLVTLRNGENGLQMSVVQCSSAHVLHITCFPITRQVMNIIINTLLWLCRLHILFLFFVLLATLLLNYCPWLTHWNFHLEHVRTVPLHAVSVEHIAACDEGRGNRAGQDGFTVTKTGAGLCLKCDFPCVVMSCLCGVLLGYSSWLIL